MADKLKKLPLVELFLSCALGYWLYILSARIINYKINCDIGWLIYAAKASTGGQVLYKDLFEINPPLIFTVHYLSNFIADILHADYMRTFNGFVLGCMVSLMGLAIVVIRPLLNNNFQKILLVAGLFIYTMLLPLNRTVFSEREHLFVLLTTPYILSVYMLLKRQRKFTLPWLIYPLAMFGFFLKPFYVMFFIAVESAVVLGDTKYLKLRKKLYFTLPALIIIYIAAVFVLTPDYFTQVLPIGLKTYYGHRFSDHEIIYRTLLSVVPLPFAFLIIAFSDNYVSADSKRLWIFLLIASVLLPTIQFKGWSYTFYPLLAFSYLSSLMIVSESNFLSEIVRALKSGFKIKQASLAYIITYALFFLAIIAIMSELFVQLSPISIYFKAFSLYFIIFFGIIIKEHKAFKYQSNALIAAGSLLFLGLYCLKQLAFNLTFLASPSLITLVVVIVIAGYLSARKVHLEANVRIFIMAFAVIALFGFYFRLVESNNRSMRKAARNDYAYMALSDIINDDPSIKSIFVFNTNLYPAFPLVNYTNVTWGSRFHHLWMLPAIYENSTAQDKCIVADKFIPERDYVYNALLSDLRVSSPQLLVFDLSPQVFLWKENPNFDWHECIKRGSPALDAFIKDNYMLNDSFNYCKGTIRISCAYEVYKHK